MKSPKSRFLAWMRLPIIKTNFFWLPFKSLEWVKVLKPCAHQDWIYLIKITVFYSILFLQNNCFLFQYILKYNLFLWWRSWIFSIITPVFSVTWSFRKNSNMLIWCSRSISSYYFLWLMINFFKILWLIESSKEQHLFETEIFLVH